MKYWISINSRRTATSTGFCNTWQTYQVASRALRDAILAEGLATRDDSQSTTLGIRLSTRAERQKESCEEYVDRIIGVIDGRPNYINSHQH